MKVIRSTLMAGGTALLAGLITTSAIADDYPSREIIMIVPFGPGGSTDIVGRIAAQALSERLEVPVVVENRGGAGGTVGTQAAAGTDADGYTITVSTTSTHVVGPLTHDAVKYDPIDEFEHIGMIGETPYVMAVSPSVEAETVADVIALAKSDPGALNYGSAGTGSTTHLAGLMFLDATGTEMEHIPYSSNAEATNALMGDEVQVLFGSMPAVLSQIKAGSIRALAVGTTTRSPQLPDTPTMQEAGVEGYRASLWLGLSAPAGTPEDAVEKLAETLQDSISNPDVAERLAQNGAEATLMSAEEFRDLIASELKTYGTIVESMN